MTANALSVSRVLLGIVVAWIGIAAPDGAHPIYLLAFVLFVLGVVTDVADGALARKRGGTLTGTLLDPAADGALVLGALLPFALRHPTLVPIFALILARDALILDLRLRLASRGTALPAVPASKAKTAFLDVGCAALLGAMASGMEVFIAIGYASLAAGAFLSITSALHYASRARALRA